MKNLKLRYLLAAAIVSLVTSTFTPAQDGSPQATLSTEPLTSDQIAVYRTVIADYLKDSNALLNVSSTTEPLDQSDPFFDRACVTNIDLETTKAACSLIHKVDLFVTSNSQLVLVERDRQKEQIEKNDPQNSS